MSATRNSSALFFLSETGIDNIVIYSHNNSITVKVFYNFTAIYTAIAFIFYNLVLFLMLMLTLIASWQMQKKHEPFFIKKLVQVYQLGLNKFSHMFKAIRLYKLSLFRYFFKMFFCTFNFSFFRAS